MHISIKCDVLRYLAQKAHELLCKIKEGSRIGVPVLAALSILEAFFQAKTQNKVISPIIKCKWDMKAKKWLAWEIILRLEIGATLSVVPTLSIHVKPCGLGGASRFRGNRCNTSDFQASQEVMF